MQLKVDYMAYQLKRLYTDASAEFDTIRIMLDDCSKKLILFRMAEVVDWVRSREKFHFKLMVFDYESREVLVDMPITDPYITDLFLSG